MDNLRTKIDNSIAAASEYISKNWPLYAFVTSNPLSGLENMPFEQAIAQANRLSGARGYPRAIFFRQAWENNEISSELLSALLEQSGIYKSPAATLNKMEALEEKEDKPAKSNSELDRLTIKWLSVFLDQGICDWEMPDRKKGFYATWLSLASYDNEIPNARQLNSLPSDGYELLEDLLAEYSQGQRNCIIQYQLTALPGWTGFIKHRIESNSEWQQQYPITLADYLAVRLSLSRQLGIPFETSDGEKTAVPDYTLHSIWLKAWEFSFQKKLSKSLKSNLKEQQQSVSNEPAPDAQMVFCIDTRSELIRRHVERAGNYHTLGFAGFFGIPMNYRTHNSGLIRKSCPPIVASTYQVREHAKKEPNQEAKTFHYYQGLLKGVRNVLTNLKKKVPASFGFVEGAGVFYGLSLLSRTLFPKTVHSFVKRLKSRMMPNLESFCQPEIKPLPRAENVGKDDVEQMSLQEKVTLAKGVFELTGWSDFAPLVAFIGHGSHTTNNPYGSSLDCGACAGTSGKHNARVLAMLCNQPEVRAALKSEYDICIPSDTLFLGGEHNTTTDEITLFEDTVPQTHHSQLKKLKKDLKQATADATAERLGIGKKHRTKSIQKAKEKAANWAETRPEWGLATNAAFIIGSRRLTRNLNLKGRSFLHSYDWQRDSEGVALEGIMKGPVTVTQWINNHYYFSTVDNNCFGSGSKITQNTTGNFGVVQGNDGDLKSGLPLQSLYKGDDEMYHQPLRLTTLIHAPLNRVKRILTDNKQSLTDLFENEWIYLAVMDPEKKNAIFHYRKGGKWQLDPVGTKELADSSPPYSETALEQSEVTLG